MTDSDDDGDDIHSNDCDGNTNIDGDSSKGSDSFKSNHFRW